MNAILNLFRGKPQEEQPTQELSFEQRQLELQQKQLELQERQLANQDPEFAYERDASKHLTADNLLEKKGLPVLNGDEVAGFVPKESIEYLLSKQYEPKVKQLEDQNMLLTQHAQTQQFLNQTVPQFEQAVKSEYGRIVNQYPNLNYADLAIAYSKIDPDPQYKNLNDENKLQLALAQLVLQENVSKKVSLAEGDGGEIDPLAGRQTSSSAPTKVDDIPDYEFILVPDDEAFNKLDTPQNLMVADFANERMLKNAQLKEKVGKRAVVEHGTLDDLKRLQRTKKDSKIFVHKQLVS